MKDVGTTQQQEDDKVQIGGEDKRDPVGTRRIPASCLGKHDRATREIPDSCLLKHERTRSDVKVDTAIVKAGSVRMKGCAANHFDLRVFAARVTASRDMSQGLVWTLWTLDRVDGNLDLEQVN